MRIWERVADAWEGFFGGAAAAGWHVPDFPCTFSGWEFLSRMASVITGYGRPLSASMPKSG